MVFGKGGLSIDGLPFLEAALKIGNHVATGAVALAEKATPLAAIRKQNSSMVLIIDSSSSDGLTTSWKAGKLIYDQHYRHTLEAPQGDGFKAALQRLAQLLEGEEPITEIHFWCHGGTGGKVYCGDATLKPEYLAPLRKHVGPNAAIWFRSCCTVAEPGKDGESPGPVAEAFAESVCQAAGFRYLAGHTDRIGLKHGQCFVYDAEQGRFAHSREDVDNTAGAKLKSLFPLA